MIKLSENKTALMNMEGLLRALDSVDYLIETYEEQKPGPAYCKFEYVAEGHSKVQFDRDIILQALRSKRAVLVEHLAYLGIDANS